LNSFDVFEDMSRACCLRGCLRVVMCGTFRRVGAPTAKRHTLAGITGIARKRKSAWNTTLCPHERQQSRCIDCGGSQQRRKPEWRVRCVHGVAALYCKRCGGSGLCVHRNLPHRCVACGGGSVCPHNALKHNCGLCNAEAHCAHGARRSRCRKCGGDGLCKHGSQRHLCTRCGGAGVCPHMRRRNCCAECGGTSICKHGRQRYACRACIGVGVCPHGRLQFFCAVCNPVRPFFRRPRPRPEATGTVAA
jgi:hypothetical protein